MHFPRGPRELLGSVLRPPCRQWAFVQRRPEKSARASDQIGFRAVSCLWRNRWRPYGRSHAASSSNSASSSCWSPTSNLCCCAALAARCPMAPAPPSASPARSPTLKKTGVRWLPGRSLHTMGPLPVSEAASERSAPQSSWSMPKPMILVLLAAYPALIMSSISPGSGVNSIPAFLAACCASGCSMFHTASTVGDTLPPWKACSASLARVSESDRPKLLKAITASGSDRAPSTPVECRITCSLAPRECPSPNTGMRSTAQP
mmetsp:Transcript_122316/g.332142  ORF Transcript_122316/g.332142 Transcript_122316/m.332142 type:complete len:261 (-) Transcript_122316:233-1015(-)